MILTSLLKNSTTPYIKGKASFVQRIKTQRFCHLISLLLFYFFKYKKIFRMKLTKPKNFYFNCLKSKSKWQLIKTLKCELARFISSFFYSFFLNLVWLNNRAKKENSRAYDVVWLWSVLAIMEKNCFKNKYNSVYFYVLSSFL